MTTNEELKATTRAALKRIRRWNIEAKEEDSERYFFVFDDVNDVEDGAACFVIGRKGSGKTAIGEHINNTTHSQRFVTNLSFKNFPFRNLYNLTDDHYNPPSEYITIWKYVIYCSICQMMARNEGLPAEVTVPLRNYFDIDFERALDQSISKITEKGRSLKFAGTGGSIKDGSTVISNETPWQERVQILEKVIDQYIDGCEYFVLFDELDEDYSRVLDEGTKSTYLDLIISLFKAVQDIRRRHARSTHIRPVVFLRDDIFELLQDNDKNKWTDNMVELNWDTSSMQRLVQHRVSRAIDDDGEIKSFREAWATIVSARQIRYGRRGRESRSPFNHMIRNTLMRPRDVVAYLRECAAVTINQDKDRIDAACFKEADKRYSRYLRREFVDELQAIIPDIDGFFNYFSHVRKNIMSPSEFREVIEKYESENGALPLDQETFCRLLYHFSVIGNVPRQENRPVFRFESAQSRFNENENICIHRGLLRALQVF